MVMEKTALPPKYRHYIEIALDSHVPFSGSALCNLVSRSVVADLEKAPVESPLRDVRISDVCAITTNEPLPKSST